MNTWAGSATADGPVAFATGPIVLAADGSEGADNPSHTVELAESLVRAERSLARQAARLAAAPRIMLVRYLDALAALALLLPWSTGTFAHTPIVRNGLQASGLLASLALMGVVLRQIVLTAVAAQPDRRAPLTLAIVGVVTGLASVVALVRLPALTQGIGHPQLQLTGPLFYGVATLAAASATVWAGRAIATARPAPDLLAGLHLASVEDVQVRLDAVEIAIRQRLADPLPAAAVLGLVVAAGAAQGTWAAPLALRWWITLAMAVVLVFAVAPVRRSTVARIQVVGGAAVILLTLRAILLVHTGVAEANGAWLSLAGGIVTTLAGLAVLLGRHARRVRVR